MSPLTHLRLAAAFKDLESTSKHRLKERWNIDDDATLVELLGDPKHIRVRFETLSEADQEALRVFLSEPLGAESIPAPEVRDGWFEAAMVFPSAIGDEHIIPLEIRTALADIETVLGAQLAVLLDHAEDDLLDSLVRIYGVGRQSNGDRLDLCIDVAEEMLSMERLQDLWDSLQPAARVLLQWACEQGRPITLTELEEQAEILAHGRHGIGDHADRVLTRFGLLLPVPGADDWLVVPADTYGAMLPLVEGSILDRLAQFYVELRDRALPARRDLFPRGLGGDVRQSLAFRLLRALDDNADGEHQADRLLAFLRIFDPKSEDLGELATYHLDVSGPEPCARQALRAWLGSLDDLFTRDIISAFGGDSGEIASWLLDSTRVQFNGNYIDAWHRLLFDLRAHLIMLLGALPAGYWYPVSVLATWWAELYQLAAFRCGRGWAYADDFPTEAMPVPSVLVGSENTDQLVSALVRILSDLLEPLGVALYDADAAMLMVNPEALRVFREGDHGFTDVWSIAEEYLGEDIDLWMPLPSEIGPRKAGIAPLHWIAEDALVFEGPAHLSDMVRLAEFSTAVQDGGRVVYVFDRSSVDKGISWEADPDEFLTWLFVRTGVEIPGRVRALFPLSTATVDQGVDAVSRNAREKVTTVLAALDEWAAHPSIEQIEELRTWGNVAAEEVRGALRERIERDRWDDPLLLHLLLMAGELGDWESIPWLLRTLGFSPSHDLEGAAGMACARIGEPALAGLLALLHNEGADVDKRLSAAGTLSAMAVLHRGLAESITFELTRAIDESSLEPDILTLFAVHLAELGHPRSDDVLYRLRDRGMWSDETMPFDEALWVSSLAPGIWGHPNYTLPLSLLYPTRSETARVQQEMGIHRILEEGHEDGVQDLEALRGVRRRRKPKKGDSRDE